ncbi:MAG: hypothetical protein ACYTFY_08715 [Planctomycetota bacterium]
MIASRESLNEKSRNSCDRFDNKKAACKFGNPGINCRVCSMGPCKITSKTDRGICGASADTVVELCTTLMCSY